MKRLSILTAFIFLQTSLLFSQTINIHLSDGSISQLNLSEIDSITFSTTSNSNSLFLISEAKYNDTDNLETIVKNLYGDEYRIADWNDIVNYCNQNSPETFINSINWQVGESYSLLVTKDGNHFYNNGDRHYYITRFDHNKPGGFFAHDNIDNNYICLGSWHEISMKILVIKK